MANFLKSYFSRPNTLTFGAYSTVIGVCVRMKFKPVTFNAFGFTCIQGSKTIASKNVLLWCHHTKVVRVYTVSNATKMVDMLITLNRTLEETISEAVRGFLTFGSAYPKLTVTVSQNSGSPQPTGGGFVDFFKESFFNTFSHNPLTRFWLQVSQDRNAGKHA